MSDKGNSGGVKVVLLGDSGVGKTCIISRYISNLFEDNVKSTNGASYASKRVDYPKLKKSLILDIWDTAGQEKFKALTKFFYKDAAIVILVYDITRRDSFDNIKNVWYQEVKENGAKDIILGIAGNKSDLYENEEVPETEAREFATSVNAIYALTSAQNNNGIDKLFEEIGESYLNSKMQGNNQDTKDGDNQGKVLKLDAKDAKEKDKKKKKKKGFC